MENPISTAADLMDQIRNRMIVAARFTQADTVELKLDDGRILTFVADLMEYDLDRTELNIGITRMDPTDWAQ